MSEINHDTNAPMNTLKPQPGQYDSYDPKFHPLPGDWARQQLSGKYTTHRQQSNHSHQQTPIQRALAAERAQHEYWMEWQGMKPGKPVYEDPRSMQNTLLPTAKYGTEGRGYG